MVMHSTAINFDLYSEEEQDAAIYAYAALLNSLSFPIEIVIRSQKKDVTSYLDLLKEAEVKAYNPVNKKNIREYRQFVEELVQERNVLDKKFYIIITFTAIEGGLISGSSFIPGMGKKNTAPLDKASILEKALTNLEPRREHLIHQFARIGLFLQQLKTQELIQLFYTIYNPESTRGIKVVNTKEYATPLVQADLAPIEVIAAKMDTPGELQTPLVPLSGAAPIAPEISVAPLSTPATPEVHEPVAPSPISSALTPPTPPTDVSIPPITPPSESISPLAPTAISETIKEGSFGLNDLTPPTPPAAVSSSIQGLTSNP